jgi:hypothetical protein
MTKHKPTPEPRQLTAVAEIQQFILAGKARFTVVSRKSGARFTFKVSASKEPGSAVTHFVSVLTGNDNETSYSYLGHVFDAARYTHGRKSKIAESAPSAAAFTFFWRWITERSQLPNQLEFWHAGACCRCGRTLTVPASIKRGIGPECAGKMGVSLACEAADGAADERAMQRMEMEADRAGTIRDEVRKWAARKEMERCHH